MKEAIFDCPNCLDCNEGTDPSSVKNFLSDTNGFLEFSSDGSLWRYEKQMKRKWLKVPITCWPPYSDEVQDHRYTNFKVAGRKVEIDAVRGGSTTLAIVHLDSELVGLTKGRQYRYGGGSSHFTSVQVADKLLHISDPSHPREAFKPPTIRVLSKVNRTAMGIIPRYCFFNNDNPDLQKWRILQSDRIIGKDGTWQDELRKYYLPKAILPAELFHECEEKGWPLILSNGDILKDWDGNPRDIRLKQFGQKSELDEEGDYFQSVIKKQNPVSRHYSLHDEERFNRLQDHHWKGVNYRNSIKERGETVEKARRDKCFSSGFLANRTRELAQWGVWRTAIVAILVAYFICAIVAILVAYWIYAIVAIAILVAYLIYRLNS